MSVQLPFQIFTVQLRSADLISTAFFMFRLKNTKTKKNCERAGKNPKNFAPSAENSFEQKPIQADELNCDEERMVKERPEKGKKRKHDLAEKSSALKKKGNQRKNERGGTLGSIKNCKC